MDCSAVRFKSELFKQDTPRDVTAKGDGVTSCFKTCCFMSVKQNVDKNNALPLAMQDIMRSLNQCYDLRVYRMHEGQQPGSQPLNGLNVMSMQVQNIADVAAHSCQVSFLVRAAVIG